eukprot:scaffold1957_cov110-Isochrysis_galbana.AAC.13
MSGRVPRLPRTRSRLGRRRHPLLRSGGGLLQRCRVRLGRRSLQPAAGFGYSPGGRGRGRRQTRLGLGFVAHSLGAFGRVCHCCRSPARRRCRHRASDHGEAGLAARQRAPDPRGARVRQTGCRLHREPLARVRRVAAADEVQQPQTKRVVQQPGGEARLVGAPGLLVGPRAIEPLGQRHRHFGLAPPLPESNLTGAHVAVGLKRLLEHREPAHQRLEGSRAKDGLEHVDRRLVPDLWPAHGLRAPCVVREARVGVAQHLVGGADALERIGRIGALVLIWMQREGLGVVGALELGLGGVGRHPELVVQRPLDASAPRA